MSMLGYRAWNFRHDLLDHWDYPPPILVLVCGVSAKVVVFHLNIKIRFLWHKTNVPEYVGTIVIEKFRLSQRSHQKSINIAWCGKGFPDFFKIAFCDLFLAFWFLFKVEFVLDLDRFLGVSLFHDIINSFWSGILTNIKFHMSTMSLMLSLLLASDLRFSFSNKIELIMEQGLLDIFLSLML